MPKISKTQIAILMASILIGEGCAHHESTARVPSSKPSHAPLTVYLIHGLMGDATTFRDLDKILEHEYNAPGGPQRIRVKALVYDTKSRTQTPSEFAKQVHHQIIEDYSNPANNLSPDAPYAFIVHSQGGIVGLKYISACVRSKSCVDPAHPEFKTPLNIHKFITLGTPFWGAPAVSRMKDGVMRLAARLLGMPEGQVRELAFGSLTLTNNRKFLLSKLDATRTAYVSPFPPGLEIHNISGDLSEVSNPPSIPRLLRDAFIGQKIETDIAVDVYSARMDFNYYLEGRTEDSQVLEGRTQFASSMSFVKLPHIPLFGMTGMAAITEKDTKAASYEHILRIFDSEFGIDVTRGLRDQLITDSPRELEVFNADVKFLLPLGYQRKISFGEKNVKLEAVDKTPFREISTTNSVIAKYHGSNDDKNEEIQKNYYTFFHQGSFASGHTFDPTSGKELETGRIHYTMRVPGWKTREFTLNVNPSYSTYAEILMEPELPLPDPRQAAERMMDNGESYFLGALRGFKTQNGTGKGMNLQTRKSDGYTLAKMNFEKGEVNFTSLSDGEFTAGISADNQNNARQCYQAQVGELEGIHKGEIFENFADPSAQKRTLHAGSKIVLVGRFSQNLSAGKVDRYLAAIDSGLSFNGKTHLVDGLAWVNVVDVDVIKSVDCPSVRH